MNFQRFKLAGAGVLSALLLSACGGGGSSTPATVHSDLSYNLSSGFQKRIELGATDDFDVTGNCKADAVITIQPFSKVEPPFEGAGIYASAQDSTVKNVQCADRRVPFGPGTQTGFTYYDSNYTPIGLEIVGRGSAVFVSPLQTTPLPPLAMSGDHGEIVTQITYDSKQVANGRRVLSYAISDARSTTTVLVDMITTSYDLDGTKLSTETSRYLMAEDDSLILKSIFVDNYLPIEYHLNYTAKE